MAESVARIKKRPKRHFFDPRLRILQKFHSCLWAQQGLGTMKRIFKQGEITAQLDSCEMDIDRRHQELLELVSSCSESFDNASSMGRNSLNTSTVLVHSPSSLHHQKYSMGEILNSQISLPPLLPILPGRRSSARGGMGKTTLAMAALHHPAIIDKFSARHFISCESANTSVDLVIQIGLHLGLEPSPQLSKIIIVHFKQCGPCLLVLDNFETPWEPSESRGDIEEFLSLLADIPSLALLITMRGAERPSKVKWTRPFLAPLEPLSHSASRQIFVEVADVPGAGEEPALDELLGLSGSLPLAVSLMASIASYEGYSETLSRWQIEHIALLSDGQDKRSNLEKSITLSLSSPRLSSAPHAKNPMSLLSLLPDGITVEVIIAGKVPIPEVHKWQSLLVRTLLAYIDVKGRLKALSPIREYIRRVHPPAAPLSRPLRTYFQDLLELFRSHRELPSSNLAPGLVQYLGNIHELMLQGLLTEEKSTLTEIGYRIIALDRFSATMLKGRSSLFQRIPHLIEISGDVGLRWRYTARCLGEPDLNPLIDDVDASIEGGVRYFMAGNRPAHEAALFYRAAVMHYIFRRSLPKATELIELALSSAQQAGDLDLHLLSLEVEFNATYSVNDPYWILAVAHKAREIAPFPSNYWDYLFTEWEAWGNCFLENLSQALNRCTRLEELLISDGMEGSDSYLELLDLRAVIYFLQSDYIQGRQLHHQIVCRTSPTCSPRFHANSLILGRYPDTPALCLAALSDPKHGMDSLLDTFRWAILYLAFVRKQKDPMATSHALRRLADLHAMLGDEDTALSLFHAALQGGTLMGIYRLRAECMVGIGDIMHRRGDSTQAKEMWTSAQPLFVRSSRMKDAAAVQGRLEQLANSHILTPNQDGSVVQTTDSYLDVVPTFDSKISADGHPSLEKLATLSVPDRAPSSLKIKTTANPETWTDV
ncbi:hypothetical protein B0H19DRAFT_1071243 [Mycena capillaripes]|nr:hypothetical protein B0H19DRAFT_1071243 [Mycena capillaripes]